MKYLIHYGMPRRSGRYPWGSGGVLETSERLAKEGLSEVDIAKALEISTTTLRNLKALEKAERKEIRRLAVTRKKDAGMSISAIAEEEGLPVQTVRDLLRPDSNAKHRIITNISNILKKGVDENGFVDIGEGVEHYLGVTDLKMKNAVELLVQQGYSVHSIKQDQMTTDNRTTLLVLGPPGSTYLDAIENKANLHIPNERSYDNGLTFKKPLPINNISMDRVQVVYDSNKDGLIEIRPGVEDLNMGSARYSQVRIAVDGTHYLKGMCVYGFDIPPGKDVVFYTSKSKDGDDKNALKKQESDPERPFSSTVLEYRYKGADGTEKRSALNIVNTEGDWENWNKNLSSQMLSKQPPSLVKRQLDISLENKKLELEEIKSLTNPVLKKHLLQEYSNTLDSSAVHLKAAAMPGQKTSVFIPVPEMKENEVFAPQFTNGTVVNIIRHPHGSISEIPTLVVNNKNQKALKTIGAHAVDAIGFHPNVAKVLSGADFDGDAGLVIPNTGLIKTKSPLQGLKDFEPKTAYPYYEGMTPMNKKQKGRYMGDVSNLITDMTLKGASDGEIARAIRHSMVVIDAEKHKLNYEQSFRDNGIAALKKKYQGGERAGASTLISKAKSTVYVPERSQRYGIDPVTGEKIYFNTNKKRLDKKGREVDKLQRTSLMAEVKDATKLSSGTRTERVYAEYANELKRLANETRLEYLRTQVPKLSTTAKKVYADAVKSLESKLKLAMMNQPFERRAQIIGEEIYKLKKANATEEWDYEERKKAKGQALVTARLRVGAKKRTIDITPREWEAIQMNAVSPTMIQRILRATDPETIRAYATPRHSKGMSPAQVSRTIALKKAGYTAAEIASALGVSVNAVNYAVREE